MEVLLVTQCLVRGVLTPPRTVVDVTEAEAAVLIEQGKGLAWPIEEAPAAPAEEG